MRAEIAALKSIRAKRDLGIFADSFVTRAGELYASDGRYAAGIPCVLVGNEERIIGGDELERLVGRLEGDIKVTFDDGIVTLRAGRMHGVIKTSDPTTMTLFTVDVPWAAPPPTLMSAMKIARPFVADQAAQPYATTLGLRVGRVVATANVSLIEVQCPGLDPPADALVPAWAADFALSADGDLTGVAFAPNYAAFRWSTGLWLRTQLITGAFPATFDGLLASIPEELPLRLDKAWRKAYDAVAGISEGIVTIEARRIVGGHGKSRVEHETEDCGVTGAVHANPKFMTAVVACAETWDPNAYPKPIPFRGTDVRGLIAGRRE